LRKCERKRGIKEEIFKSVWTDLKGLRRSEVGELKRSFAEKRKREEIKMNDKKRISIELNSS